MIAVYFTVLLTAVIGCVLVLGTFIAGLLTRWRKFFLYTCACCTVVTCVACILLWPAKPARATTSQQYSAYVWQRKWTKNVSDAVQTHGGEFHTCILLGAELNWTGERMDSFHVPVDYSAVKAMNKPIGIAIRIGGYTENFSTQGIAFTQIITAIKICLAHARSMSVEPVEIHIDCDCPTSQLSDFAQWIHCIKQKFKHLKVSFTALPSWFNSTDIHPLINAADSYVLQVHSLERPTHKDSYVKLCDEKNARRAVEYAGYLNKPFRVALPTYGYRLYFDNQGKYAGISAENNHSTATSHPFSKYIVADPASVSELVRLWSTNRPANMTGIIWYRLPNRSDRLNWSWHTLEAIMRGEKAAADIRTDIQHTARGLYDLAITNAGNADGILPETLCIRWKNAEHIAHDAVNGYIVLSNHAGSLYIKRNEYRSPLLPPETITPIGWLRLSDDVEVTYDAL